MFIRRLGSGSFGRVDLMRNIATGEERVCKTVNIAGMKKDALAQMRREVRVLSLLDHPNIVKIYEFAEDMQKGELILILEYIPRGDCGALLKHQGPLQEQDAARMVRHLLVAVAYCHEHGIIHRDIKPENLMLSRSSRLSSHDCKVIDFGLAARAAFSDDAPASPRPPSAGDADGAVAARGWQTPTSPAEHRERALLTRRVGTPVYMAPEVVDRCSAYTSKADIWSAGVVALELLTGRRIFAGKDMKATFARIRKCRGAEDVLAAVESSQNWQKLSAECQQFLLALLEVSPEKRPSASEALAHPWLQQQPKNEAAEVPSGVARSLEMYARAKPVVRQCLSLIASRTNCADIEGLDAAFLNADKDSNGHVSLHDLACEFGFADVGGLHAQLQKGGGEGDISYTEFLAACLCGKFGSVRELAAQAFAALDADRDGQVSRKDVSEVFGQCPLLEALPNEKTFGVEDWVAAVQSANGSSSPSQVTKLRLCVAGARFLTR